MTTTDLMRRAKDTSKRTRIATACLAGVAVLGVLYFFAAVTTEEALHIPGIGAAKIQRYAEPFLDAIRIWKQSRRA